MHLIVCTIWLRPVRLQRIDKLYYVPYACVGAVAAVFLHK